MRAEAAALTDDAILNGRLRLWQPRRGHRFGHDAILLAAAVPARPGQRAAEFGAGVGAASLALLARVPQLSITLIERDADLCALAQRNIERNGFSDSAQAVQLDVTATSHAFAAAGLAAGAFDHVLMNPPFNDPRHQSSPDASRRAAHAGDAALPGRWLAGACGLLRAGGQVTLIWRADGLADILAALAHDFGDIAVTPVYPAPCRAAIRTIVRAAKAGRGPLALLPPLTLNGRDGRPSAEAERILRQGEPLPAAESERQRSEG